MEKYRKHGVLFPNKLKQDQAIKYKSRMWQLG